MSDELLPYYNKELAYVRKLGREFAREHPDVAAALDLGEGQSKDPHVERLVMAFAYLTGRIRHKLDDEFPEISDSYLQVLCPHFLRPLPSMAIVELALKRDQAGLLAGYPVPRESALATQPVDGEPCYFRTCYPLRLWPFSVRDARLEGGSFESNGSVRGAASVLRIDLETFADETTFAKLPLRRIRLYLQGRLDQHAYELYEVLLNNVLEVTVGEPSSGGKKDRIVRSLGEQVFRPVGFREQEAILPLTQGSFSAYRLLTEYFHYRKKFCFVDLLLPERALEGLGSRVEITVSLDRSSSDLEDNVSAESFRLGCTPAVNLFDKPAVTIDLDHTTTEYRVVPARANQQVTEVFSIDSVAAQDERGHRFEFLPFYSARHEGGTGSSAYWYATRRQSKFATTADEVNFGTEVFLSLVDLKFSPAGPADTKVEVATTCLNRNLPEHLPFGGGQPRFKLVSGGPLEPVRCLTKPTRTVRPDRGPGATWRLISHLSLNHLSLWDPGGDPGALRELLRLYDHAGSAEIRAKIEAITSVRGRRVVGRVRDALHDDDAEDLVELEQRPDGGEREAEPLQDSLCRGVEIALTLDDSQFSDRGLFLFATVLERFLGLYCNLNSFTQLVLWTTSNDEGPLKTWNPRAGDRILL